MMTPDEIVVSVLPGDARGAWLRDGQLVRMALDDGACRTRRGDIYLGRVTHVDRALGAAFVDIGAPQAGLLMLGDSVAGPAGDKMSEGQAAVVQVVRAPDESKGAKLTGRLKLRSAFLSLLPFGCGVDLAARAKPLDRSEAMLEQARDDLSPHMGWLLHQRGVEVDRDALKSDAEALLERWQALNTAVSNGTRAPVRLESSVDEVTALVRDGISSRLSCVHVDDTDTYMRLRALFPDVEDLFKAYRGPVPAFAAFQIDEQLEEACAPVVSLPSGGRIMIAETEALVAIDVNTGATGGTGNQSSAMTANLEAAVLLARVIQLRQLAGHIVIDFVPLRKKHHRAKVLAEFREAMSEDDHQVDIAGYSQLGLVHLTRERLGPTLRHRLTVPCCTCAGEGRVISPVVAAGDGLRHLMAEAMHMPGRRVALHVSADVAAALETHLRTATAACARRLGYTIAVRGDPILPNGRYQVSGERRESRGV